MATTKVSKGVIEDGAITIGKLNAQLVVTQAEGISGNDNDTTIPTSAAVKDYTDNAYTAGNDIDITASVITNTAPDQIVAITGTGDTVVTGTYPSFNISSDSGVTQIIAGTDISISPGGGAGIVTINSTSQGGVTSIVAGDNVTISPGSGLGDVTINSVTPSLQEVTTVGNTTSDSITIESLFLNDASASNGVIYYDQIEDRVTLANYNVGGSVYVETNGGSYVAKFLSNTNTELTGDLTVGGATTSTSYIVQSGTATEFLKGDGTLDNNSYALAADYITSLTGEATGSGPGAAAVTLTNSAVIGKTISGVNVTGGTISGADTILTAFGKLQNQINGLIGSTKYEGVWNASTNTPTITSSVGTDGAYYIVNVAGSTNINGISSWNIGDWIIFHDTAWQKVDNTDAVVSVNGQVGAVSLSTTNIAEGTNLYYTEARVNVNTNVAANTAARHSAVTLGTANGLGLTGQQISLGLSSSTTNGALSSADWTNFNNKTDTLGTVTSVSTGTGLTGGPITTSGTISIASGGVSATQLNVTGNGTATQYLRSDGDGSFTWATPTDTIYTLPVATDTALGGIELFSNLDQTVAANVVTTTAGRTYGIQLNAANQAVVNVPWTDANTTYSAGTGLALTGTVFSNTITNNNQLTNGAGYTTNTGTVTSVATNNGLTGGTISTTGTIGLATNGITATYLNVVGNGTTAQYLRSDGDGTFTWATPTDTNTTYTAGGGLALAGTVFSHADTSAQVSVDNSGNTVIQDVTLDTYGHVTGLVSANITSVTGNAGTASTFSTNQNSYKGFTDNSVAGMMMWKNFGNNHTIFDASNSTSPTGSAVNNTNPTYSWAGTYPTLMGWNGISTYGVRVDRARYAEFASTVTHNANRTDGTAYPVGWFSTTNSPAYSCAAVTIQSSTGTLSATNGNFSGNVGINEINPTSLLHFSTQTAWGTSTNRIININNTGSGGNVNVAHNLGSITWYSSNSVPTAEIAAYRNTPASGNNVELRFYTAAAGTVTERMRLETDGDLHVDGDVIAYSTTISDERLKDNIQTIDSALDKISNLRGVSYTWNNGSRKGQKDLGLIAQEVEQVLPELVREKEMPMIDGGTYKTVDYEKMVAVLIESIKELSAKVKTLEAKLQ